MWPDPEQPGVGHLLVGPRFERRKFKIASQLMLPKDTF